MRRGIAGDRIAVEQIVDAWRAAVYADFTSGPCVGARAGVCAGDTVTLDRSNIKMDAV